MNVSITSGIALVWAVLPYNALIISGNQPDQSAARS
jgi:hypothetical protein